INVNAILEELHNCKASSKWFIVDACREYMIPKRSSRLPKISRGINSAANGNLPEDVFFLQSCKIGESSYEDNGNGLFTRCFADALDGKADANNNGELTVLEVFEYVYTNVKKDALENLNKRQTPTFSIPEIRPTLPSFIFQISCSMVCLIKNGTEFKNCMTKA
ncbi:MAG: caspase family protein, partial [Thermoguttaceae bacterium]|nr:caspase family protein [Thermoguttaceae bacterium]